MQLQRLAIINYKSCQQIALDFFSGTPTVLIGKNDCGKSTILTAIGLLLTDKPKPLNTADFSNTRCPEVKYALPFLALEVPPLDFNEDDCVIVGKFELNQDLFASDISYSAQLLLAKQLACKGSNSIFLARRYSAGKVETFIHCEEATDVAYQGSWMLTAPALAKKTKELEINDADIVNDNGVGKLSNFERIRAILQKVPCSNQWVHYTQATTDRSIFPDFLYLDWKVSLEDITNLATQTLKSTIESHFQDIQSQVDELALSLEVRLSEELHTAYLPDIQSVIQSIQAIKAKVTRPEVGTKISDIFFEKDSSDGPVRLEAQGEGVKRQIWFALIQNAARKKLNQQLIWAFDEPETHLYPTAQRHLYDILRQASSGSIQIILSTHSTLFVDRALFSCISRIGLDSGYTTHTRCSSVSDIYDSLGLRNSDFLFYDRFLVVEGETEKHLIPKLYKLYTNNSLQEDNIQLVVLGGSGKWRESKAMLESAFKDFGKEDEQLIYIFDSDQHAIVGTSFDDSNIYFVGRQDIEDSIDNSVWTSVVIDAIQYWAEIEEKQELLPVGAPLVTDEEIQVIKDSIPTTSAQTKDKFDAKVKAFAKEKVGALIGEKATFSVLRDKGEAAVDALMKHITDISQVGPEIKAAFDRIRPVTASITEVEDSTAVEAVIASTTGLESAE